MKKEKKKKTSIEEAIANQNPKDYFEAYIKDDLSENIDPYLLERYMAERLVEERKMERHKQEKSSNFDYATFGREVESNYYEPQNIFFDSVGKSILLEKCGLIWLKTGKNERVRTIFAESSRIGKVFKERYDIYKENH